MSVFVLPKALEQEAKDSLKKIRYGNRSIRAELELQTERLMKLAEPTAIAQLKNEKRYGRFEVSENYTAIRHGKQIPHSTECYITVWTWDAARCQFYSSVSAWGGVTYIRPWQGMLLVEL